MKIRLRELKKIIREAVEQPQGNRITELLSKIDQMVDTARVTLTRLSEQAALTQLQKRGADLVATYDIDLDTEGRQVLSRYVGRRFDESDPSETAYTRRQLVAAFLRVAADLDASGEHQRVKEEVEGLIPQMLLWGEDMADEISTDHDMRPDDEMISRYRKYFMIREDVDTPLFVYDAVEGLIRLGVLKAYLDGRVGDDCPSYYCGGVIYTYRNFRGESGYQMVLGAQNLEYLAGWTVENMER